MDVIDRNNTHAALSSLEAAAALARGGFACIFSSSDEYEMALISERRAQGRYNQPRNSWALVMFICCTLVLMGTVLLFK